MVLFAIWLRLSKDTMWLWLLGPARHWLKWRHSQSLWVRVSLTSGSNLNVWMVHSSFRGSSYRQRKPSFFALYFPIFQCHTFPAQPWIYNWCLSKLTGWKGWGKRSLQVKVPSSLGSGAFGRDWFFKCFLPNQFPFVVTYHGDACVILDCPLNPHIHRPSSQQSITCSFLYLLQLSFLIAKKL